MRVRMRVSVSGARDGHEWPGVGQVFDVGDEEAMELSRSGIADIVPDDAEAHTPPEVDDPSGRPVDAAEEAPVERAVADDEGETAATETGTSAQRKAARAGRRSG